MIEQLRQTLHDGKTESQSSASIAGRVVQLHVFFEYRLQCILGHADSCIPDFDSNVVTATSAADQYAAGLGVADSVGDEVVDDTREQTAVGTRQIRSGHHAQLQPFVLGSR